MSNKGLLFIVSAPAGTGKTTLVEQLVHECPTIIRGITCTTRPPRPHEVNGRDYFFLTEEEFHKREHDLLEQATVFGYHYGTERAWVEKTLAEGKHVVLVIDIQGAMQVKKKIKSISIFLSPPSWDELRRRLKARGTESPATLEKRLERAHEELEMISHYDYHIVNDQLLEAYGVLKSIVVAEQHRVIK